MRFHKHKIENLINIEKLVTIHYLELNKNFSSKGETHDFWEIVFCDYGEVLCYRDNNAAIILKEKELIFHKPTEFHKLKANGKNAANVFVITFSSRSQGMSFFNDKQFLLADNMFSYIVNLMSEARKTFDIPAFEPYITKLNVLPTPLLGGSQMIKMYLEQLLILLMRKHSCVGGVQLFVSKQLEIGNIESLIASYLKENLYKKITIDDVCKKFNYGKTHLSIKFKEATGKPIAAYYNNLKITEAKRLLRENKTVSQIAELLNYDTLAYFCYTFKKQTTFTPKQYLKTINK